MDGKCPPLFVFERMFISAVQVRVVDAESSFELR
jgi:hypothetical protein